FALEKEAGADLMLEIVRHEGSGVLRRGNLLRETAESFNDADFFCRVAKRLLESALRDLPRCESVVGDDRGLLRHHEQQICIHDGLAIGRAVLAAVGIDPSAEAVLAPDEEGQPVLELALGGRQETDHAAEVVVMAMAEYERVELLR